jgi:rhodanese-related sulfurtransferase
MSRCTLVTVEEAQRMIADMPVLVLDMRDFRAYQNGHFPKSIHLNDLNMHQLLKHTAKQVPILIYCDHGHKSQDMVKVFVKRGFTNCFSLDGGFDVWYQKVNAPTQPLSELVCTWLSGNGFNPTNLDARGWNNETALICAAREGNYYLCAELLAAGASVDAKNKDGNNALWMACLSNSQKIADLLIEYDIDVDNQNDNGATALIHAASNGKTKLVKNLVFAGANVHLATLDDFTAVHVASNREILNFLRAQVMPLAQVG